MVGEEVSKEEADEMDEKRVETLALHHSLRLLYVWGVLWEGWEETRWREEVLDKDNERYMAWWATWCKFEEGRGHKQGEEDKRRETKTGWRTQLGHDTCTLCMR